MMPFVWGVKIERQRIDARDVWLVISVAPRSFVCHAVNVIARYVEEIEVDFPKKLSIMMSLY